MDISQTVQWAREENVSPSHQLFILVETSTDLDPSTLPPQVGIEQEAGPWRVHFVGSLLADDPTADTDTFQIKLLALLQQEGKSMDEVKAIVMGDQSPKSDISVDLVNAIGEEEYEIWMEQAAQMTSEWQCTEAAKKQRIVESLRGPAADIVRFLKVSSPSATANEYLAALETAYGTTESGPDLMARFRHTYQESGEKLSAFLYRLDKLLHRALLKGGIDAAGINRARMEQLIKGALTNDMVALRIRMTHTLQNPPSFSQLMKEIREEEHWVAARENVKVSVATVVSPQASVPSELQNLKKEVKELSTQMSQLLNVVTAPCTSDCAPQKMPVKNPESVNRDNSQKPKPIQPPVPVIFCYKCGEDGHKKWECKAPEDLRKVNQKLIKMHRLQGNWAGAQ
ncbi:hypothetical protein QQF64_013337 [Cirrhinus molitorella]|uniref:CCHC-type domain-containing protein n=1 Tax=Cirrhinus molitorella TaxID=172907 RepID=A0ABR3LQV3_9TELE